MVDAERALLSGEIASATVAWGWIAAVVTAVVGLAVVVKAMKGSAN